jgi:non-heme chloroperoxidase
MPYARTADGAQIFYRLQCTQVGLKAASDGIAEPSEPDAVDDLATSCPRSSGTAEHDQIVPLAATAPRTASMLSDAALRIYPGGSRGLIGEFEAQFDHDLLNLIKA